MRARVAQTSGLSNVQKVGNEEFQRERESELDYGKCKDMPEPKVRKAYREKSRMQPYDLQSVRL